MKNKEQYKLIILEDEPAHSQAIKRALVHSESDFQITEAASLKEFRKAIRELTPDLIIADINLPDGTAFDILDGNLEKQSKPVLIMTSFGDEETAVKAIKSGALDYIVKSSENFKNIEHVVNRNIRAWINIRKRIESEKQYHILFETMEQGVVYHDLNNYIISANPAAEKILGVSVKQMRGRTSSDQAWKALNEDGSPCPGEYHPAVLALKTGYPVRDRVMGIYNPEKDAYIWILISAIPQFRHNENTPYQVFTTFTDITEIKRTESEFKKARDKAEESDRLKSAFMANMSHEIRTPMNGVLGFAELLKMPGLTDEKQRTFIDVIEKSGQRMLTIIDDLIDISRIEAGMAEIKNESTDLRKLLSDLLLLFMPESEKRGIALKSNIQLPSKEFFIEADKTKLAQVITNLLKNALKFTEKGSIELGCRINDHSNLFFYVKDTGMGITPALLNKIFERFRQGDSSDKQEGVGLGLAISKAYIELMGGKIKVESEPGEGSVFSFTIPFNGQEMPLTAQEVESPLSLLPCLNILIAEDDEISYFFLKESLSQKHIFTQRASNGQEAVDMIRNQSKINLVLMDIRMPVMDGIEAIKQIKKIKPETPIIAQSAFATEKEIHHSFEAGCDDYITKPIDIHVLLNKISFYTASLA
jgi:PAS domain S-box-containing protein